MTKRIARLALVGAALTAFALPAAPAAANPICVHEDPTIGSTCVTVPAVRPICPINDPTLGPVCIP